MKDIFSKNIASEQEPVICWWSGGVTSAVACKIALDLYGLENCRIIYIDTKNEHEDTKRFLKDCESWYNKSIETITSIGDGQKYESVESIWYDKLSLNVAKGAICSSESKRSVRVKFQRQNKYSYQVFGFDSEESKRAINIKKNYPTAKPIFPLQLYGLKKKDCFKILKENNIKIPEMYNLGFHNNNCFGTGCVQGGVGYWKKIQKEYPEKFNKMAEVEHDLTNLKGKPVTILKDQSNQAKETGTQRVFLKPHVDYPQLKCIDDMKGQEIKNIVECNGFCGIQGNLFAQF